MKQLKHFLSFFGLMALSCNLLGQSCYVQFFDGSGYSPLPTEHLQLEGAACNLLQAFPQSMRGSFGVFDCGFYLHNESMPGQFPHFFETAVNMAKAQKEYYLVFGRQTDHTGVNTKIWVALNLPRSGSFSCMSEFEFSILNDKVYSICNSNLKSGIPSSAIDAEVEAMRTLKEIVASAVECCYVSNLRRAEECRSPLIEEYYDKNFTLKSVSFLNTRPIKNDDDEQLVVAPQWENVTIIDPDNSKKTKEKIVKKPILYLQNQTIQVNVKITLTNPLPPNTTVFVKGESKNGVNIFNIPSTPATINIAENTIEISNVNFSEALPPGVNYFEEFTIEWSVSVNNSVSGNNQKWGKAGVSKNRLYVILAPSLDESKIHETFYFIGCKNAKGKTNLDELFDPIWAYFTSCAITNVKNEPLRYYGDRFVTTTSPEGLIKNGDGQCGSFARLLIYVLHAQGKRLKGGENDDNNFITFFVGTSSEDRSQGFLVKKWSFSNPNQPENTEYPYYQLSYQNGGVLTYVKIEYKETKIIPLPGGGQKEEEVIVRTEIKLGWDDKEIVTDNKGLPGQNSADPNSIFNNHQIVFYNGVYYDPSYGKSYNNLSDIVQNALAGFYKVGIKMIDDQQKAVFFFKESASSNVVLKFEPQKL